MYNKKMILINNAEKDYELLDSGEGEKLERFGNFILRRPDPEVLWQKKNLSIWQSADASFVKDGSLYKWKYKNENLKNILSSWKISVSDINLILKIGNFKNIGFFPEQIENWHFMKKVIEEKGRKDVRVLNLFGYTGCASIYLSKFGVNVTHIDASKASVFWANKNKELNNGKPIRFLLDDARKFIEREIKRGAYYDGIVMDPPVYGKSGTKKWHLEEDFIKLLERSVKVLSNNPIFFLISGYASAYSHISYKNSLGDALKGFKNDFILESGELAIKESKTERLLPSGIFVRAVFE